MQITIVIDTFDELKKLRSLLEVKTADVKVEQKQLKQDKLPGKKAEKNSDKTEDTVRGRNGKRTPVDSGKIKALRRAGWSAEKIADEMRCSLATVYNHLK